MIWFIMILPLLTLSCCPLSMVHTNPKDIPPVVWNIDNLELIGGYPVTVLGSPKVIDTPQGKAVYFDGNDDGFIIGNHPLEGADVFTLEIIFKPEKDGLPEQRFFHLQEDGSDNRVLIETRLMGDVWALDTFIKSGETNQPLLDMTLTHPVGEWYNATLVFDGKEMRHYINGVKELSATITSFTTPKSGKTSIGVRMNKAYWFRGAIRQARFTRTVLTPDKFLKP
jgi:hypothetical protein